MLNELKNINLSIVSLGEPSINSPILHHVSLSGDLIRFIPDNERIYADMKVNSETHHPDLSFELAGPRKKIYFSPEKTKVAVVTCGGLCPGLNDVIRAIVMSLYYWYDVRNIIGIRYGYAGLAKEPSHAPIPLTPDNVSSIHTLGGTILGSSRGCPPVEEIVDTLQRLGINILFCIGGDGTLRGANQIYEEVQKRNLPIAIVGIPKTIDNDIPLVYRTFGFQSAVEEARKVLDCAHVEAKGARNGVGLVKLMGRDAGFIAAYASRASGDVNYCLIPEIKFPLFGQNGLIPHLRDRLRSRHHAIIVVAEGAGKHLVGVADERDESGNIKYKDIGHFLKQEIEKAFKEYKEEIHIKYFDPSYVIRSIPANAEDSIFCADLARYAVDAAMAGKTALLIGYWHGEFIHVPLSAIAHRKKFVNPEQRLWQSVIQNTGQPSDW